MSDQKFVIFVDEDLVAGSAQLAASADGAVAGATSAADNLFYRRTVLADLATSLRGGTGANPATSMTAGAVAQAAVTASGFGAGAAGLGAPAADDDDVQILEGVGALVVDGATVDVASLKDVVGLTVVFNVELRLPMPIEAEATTVRLADDWHLRKIGLYSGAPGGAGVLIGVLDTGIDAAHAEFAGKTVHFAEFDALGRKIGSVARDAGEHGTHVCSTAAGATAGVAPQADLAVAAVLTKKDGFGRMSGSLVQIINGFNWLITQNFGRPQPGVDIINASLGGGGYNAYLQKLVRNAVGLGIPLIAAIGNQGRGGPGHHSSPGNYPESLSVGATDQQDQVADFSDWGIMPPPGGPNYPLPELSAPGVNVWAAKPGGGMQYMSGTSMATPVVAGVAARRMASNPGLRGRPSALAADLRSRVAACTLGPFGNSGGLGRIIG